MAAGSTLSRRDIDARVKKAVADNCRKKNQKIQDGQTLVGSLGFDSLRMVSMTLALEEALGRSLMLMDWLTQADDPSELTVGSLCDHVWKVVHEDGG